MNQILLWQDRAVVQLPKSGSNTLYRAWSGTAGSSIPYDLSPDFKTTAQLSVPVSLTIPLREPVDRYWAGLRQDYLDSHSDDLTAYLRAHEQQLAVTAAGEYRADSDLHTLEDITYRLLRIVELTRTCWSRVVLLPIDSLTDWLNKEWHIHTSERHNSHGSALIEAVTAYRQHRPDVDDRIRALPRIRAEYHLWDLVGQTFTVSESVRTLIQTRHSAGILH